MKFILSPSTNPYFNLAAEEYLLHEYHEDVYFQYINDPSVVVGKHQNAVAEVDLDYLEEHKILLARRISGGGAVYHDHGNLNFSFLTKEQPGNFVRFKKYTEAIIAALRNIGLKVELGSRNELLLGGKKISGTASHVYKTRVLHHGTLLYNANINRLSSCLYVDSGHLKSKAVQSIRSDVTNLSQHMEEVKTSDEFNLFLFHSVSDFYADKQEYSFKEFDLQAIENLVKTKFSTWEWNFGYSPKYSLTKDLDMDNTHSQIITTVEKGFILEIDFKGSVPAKVKDMAGQLVGLPHSRKALGTAISRNEELKKDLDKLLEAFF